MTPSGLLGVRRWSKICALDTRSSVLVARAPAQLQLQLSVAYSDLLQFSFRIGFGSVSVQLHFQLR